MLSAKTAAYLVLQYLDKNNSSSFKQFNLIFTEVVNYYSNGSQHSQIGITDNEVRALTELFSKYN